MESNKAGYSTIDEYIATFPGDIQQKLEAVRATIKNEAPEAQEKISYQMPTFYLYGNLVHFAAFKNHIGFFPIPSGIEAFKDELSQFETSKGGIRFPLSQPLPLKLISKIVKFRVDENLKKAKQKANKKKA
jgi:uncharacterized protein YdhG (YjbR/CyaY superfamily)